MKDKKGNHTFNTIDSDVWILDLGATYHMTHFPKFFNSYVKMTKE